LHQVFGMATQEFGGFWAFGAQHNAHRFAVLVHLKPDMAKLFRR
jgi:hypothetical protein